jgi:stage II sporulation protein AA (anti-sigma F factor antagonist)
LAKQIENEADAVMDLVLKEKKKSVVVKIIGEIDQHNAEELRESVDKAFDRSRCKHMIFDFSAVSFMDSSGIGLLIGRYKSVKVRGGSVAIAGMNRELSRIYAISGLKKIMKCYVSIEEAEKELESLAEQT